MIQKPERIAKVIARSGLCSRRDAERMILQGRVKIDGKIIDSPAVNVIDENIILVDEKPLKKADDLAIWLFHKPKGCITTNKDPQGRTTVFDLLPDSMPRVISIGRLDYNTEGLLLLTNSGELARKIELPSTGWVRTYKVRAFGKINNTRLEQLRKGIEIEGIKYAPADIKLQTSQKDNHWLEVSITEGKNREVRKILEYADLTVNRLIRTSYGIFELGDLALGQLRKVPSKMLDNIFS